MLVSKEHPFGYTACETDDWILSHFEPGFCGFAAEIGAYDGFTGSATLKLEQQGWQVLCVEPNPEMRWYLHGNRKLVWMGACSDYESESDSFHIHLDGPGGFSALKPIKTHQVWHPSPDANWKEVQVHTKPLGSLLHQFEFPRLDALCVDCEGGELAVLKGLDLDRWQPKVIITESWDERSDTLRHLEAHGYKRVERRGVDDLYIRRSA